MIAGAASVSAMERTSLTEYMNDLLGNLKTQGGEDLILIIDDNPKVQTGRAISSLSSIIEDSVESSTHGDSPRKFDSMASKSHTSGKATRLIRWDSSISPPTSSTLNSKAALTKPSRRNSPVSIDFVLHSPKRRSAIILNFTPAALPFSDEWTSSILGGMDTRQLIESAIQAVEGHQ